jgi:hypothetical protein
MCPLPPGVLHLETKSFNSLLKLTAVNQTSDAMDTLMHLLYRYKITIHYTSVSWTVVRGSLLVRGESSKRICILSGHFETW